MKALTVRQPWASLIAAGVKSIETRSWSTAHRGPLAIHAAVRDPNKPSLGGTWTIGDWFVVSQCEPYYWELRQAARRLSLPLGMVVATCELVDVVPIIAFEDGPPEGSCVTVMPSGIVKGWFEQPGSTVIAAYDEAAFGDYTPGRYAWILDNVVAIDEPIPARGRQGLWEWTPPRSGEALDQRPTPVAELHIDDRSGDPLKGPTPPALPCPGVKPSPNTFKNDHNQPPIATVSSSTCTKTERSPGSLGEADASRG